MIISFSLLGKPIPKARARFARRGSNVVAFTPDKTAQHEQAIGYAGKVAAMGRVLDGPIRLEAVFGLPIPPSWPKWKRLEAAEGTLRPAGRPDTDNLLKAVLDGLNGVIWKDDAQIVHIVVEKLYSVEPFTAVRVAEWNTSTQMKANISSQPSNSWGVTPTC